MGLYTDAQKTKQMLMALINECISENETIKSCIKARRALVTTAANAETGKVGVKLIGDNTEIFLPYNAVFRADELVVGVLVSVWYSYKLNNGVVMQNSKWQRAGNANEGQVFDPTGTYPALTAGTANKVANDLSLTQKGVLLGTYDGSQETDVAIPDSKPYEFTLTTGGWDNNNRQIITLPNVTASAITLVYPKDSSANAYINAGITDVISNGQIVFTCSIVPSVNITVCVEIIV